MSVIFKHLNYIYAPKTKFEHLALDDINLEIVDGSFNMLVGHTGSGKSTLVQQINALLIPSSGEIDVDDIVVDNNIKKTKRIKDLRKKVGLVFQFPEYQLFEETVLKDVSFGPKNFNYSDEEAINLAKDALNLVGIDESYYEKSPFELSGGEKRRVAIAGIITLNPQVLILDEPTAGLDPQGSRQMMNLFKKINEERGTTIIMITHDMDNVIRYGSRVIVLKDGKLVKDSKPYELFLEDDISYLSLEEPDVIKFSKQLISKGMKIDLEKVKDIDSLVKEIMRCKHE